MGTDALPGDAFRRFKAHWLLACENQALLRQDPLGPLKDGPAAFAEVLGEAADEVVEAAREARAAAARAEVSAGRIEAELKDAGERPPLDYKRVERTISDASLRTIASVRVAIDRRTVAIMAGGVTLAFWAGVALGWIAHGR